MQVNYTADLDALATLERIVKMIPHSLQSRRETRNGIAQEGREPTVGDLVGSIYI